MSNRFDNHPNIGSIIRTRDQIYQTLLVDCDYSKALLQMSGFIGSLKPDDQDKNLISELEKEYLSLSDAKSLIKKDKQINTRRTVYWGWWREINRILWEKKYLENEKYGMYFPSEAKP